MTRIRTPDEKRRNAESARRSAAKYPERRKAARKAYYEKNREILCAKGRAHREKVGPLAQNKHRLAQQGWTVEGYIAAKEAQGGRCDICGQIPDRVLNADHCHKTLRPRALLCGPCNRGLGSFRDVPEWLERAANYLRRFR